jgi:Domain of unknown function (DUF4922)
MLDENQYRRSWRNLNQDLRRIETAHGNLGGALDALYEHQIATGFVRDDLSEIERYSIAHPEDSNNVFRVQFNPRRAQRFGGRGRQLPPPGQAAQHDGCFLCPDNIQWQQGGSEMGYEIELNARHYIAWMNPYPLGPAHAIIAAGDHRPQAWASQGGAERTLPLRDLIADLVAVVRRLPGYLGFYNGVDAGASIPWHLHYHALRRPMQGARFPIERLTDGCEKAAAVFTEGYPVDFAYWRGEAAFVATSAGHWADEWTRQNATRAAEMSANIMAMADEGTDEVRLYFVPRSRVTTANAVVMPLVGGLEMLGELVFCSAEERRRLRAGEIDYFTIERILANVCMPLAD